MCVCRQAFLSSHVIFNTTDKLSLSVKGMYMHFIQVDTCTVLGTYVILPFPDF